MRVVGSLQQWADAVAELPTVGRIPRRTVLVPNARVAHALRRELVETARASALIGTRFISVIQLASESLLDAGEPDVPNDRELGPAWVRQMFAEIKFERFQPSDLQELPGWDIAFTRTIADLDGALLLPAACLDQSDPHVRDVGRVHEALSSRTDIRTVGSILQRAAALAPSRRDAAPLLAVLTGFESAAELSLLRALPALEIAVWAVRPRRALWSARFAALAGPHLPAADARALRCAPESSALAHLQMRLFEDIDKTPAPDDSSVSIALYAGVHEEVEAAASWVTEQIVEHGVAAQDIAVLSSVAEPYSSLLRARLAAIPMEPSIDTFSERGIPLIERADGARLLVLLRAWRQGLSRESLAPLLPMLRPLDEERRLRGLGRAWEVLNVVAAIGGSQANLAAGSSWPTAWRIAQEQLAAASTSGAVVDEREVEHRVRMQGVLSSLAPAIDALTGVLSAVIADEPLHLLWARILDFAQMYLVLPFSAPPATAVLDQACGQFRGYESCEPAGAAAIAWLDDTLCQMTVQSSRFGMPAVYLGTFAGVRGLRFRAVRMIGLAEGSVPSAVREDPVLPDAAREKLSGLLLGSRLRAHRQVVAFDDAVRCASERLCLTAPRASIEGSARQPAAVLLDVVRALTGSNASLEKELEHAAALGRARERSARDFAPVTSSAQLERIAHGDRQLGNKGDDPALSLHVLRAIRDRTDASAQDGLLTNLLPASSIAGLGPDRPISPSRLKTLLACPHQFLYENILKFREPEGPYPAHRLPDWKFGNLLHLIAEEFWIENGHALGSRQGELVDWQKQLRAFAAKHLDAYQRSYPFANSMVATATFETLCDQLEKLLRIDWNEGRTQSFVAVERVFGYAGECDLDTAVGSLFIRGKIDKLDMVDDVLVIRDIKTGWGKPRRRDDLPDPGIDLQVAVYARVAKRMAHAWGTPERVAVAYIYLRGGEPDRSWRGNDYKKLEDAANVWLATARETLEASAFARTPNPSDCKYCPYKPVCASEMHRAEGVLNDARVPRRLKLLKAPEAE